MEEWDSTHLHIWQINVIRGKCNGQDGEAEVNLIQSLDVQLSLQVKLYTEWKLYNGHLWKISVYLLHLLNGVDLTNFCSFMACEKHGSSCVLHYSNMLTFSQRSDAWRLCFFKTQTPYNPGWVFTDSHEPHLPITLLLLARRHRCGLRGIVLIPCT